MTFLGKEPGIVGNIKGQNRPQVSRIGNFFYNAVRWPQTKDRDQDSFPVLEVPLAMDVEYDGVKGSTLRISRVSPLSIFRLAVIAHSSLTDESTPTCWHQT